MHRKQEAFERAEELKKNPPKPKKERRFFRGACSVCVCVLDGTLRVG